MFMNSAVETAGGTNLLDFQKEVDDSLDEDEAVDIQ